MRQKKKNYPITILLSLDRAPCYPVSFNNNLFLEYFQVQLFVISFPIFFFSSYCCQSTDALQPTCTVGLAHVNLTRDRSPDCRSKKAHIDYSEEIFYRRGWIWACFCHPLKFILLVVFLLLKILRRIDQPVLKFDKWPETRISWM